MPRLCSRACVGCNAVLGVGAIGATVVLMAALPTIEKVFNVTTGMTLIELRDPKQPLLRELQQR